MQPGSKILEVSSFLTMSFWVNLVKCSPKYSHTVFVAVYMYLAWYTLYLYIVSNFYNFNHALYLQCIWIRIRIYAVFIRLASEIPCI